MPGIFNSKEMAYTDSLWLSLSARAEALRTKIPAEAQDAFYQLVLLSGDGISWRGHALQRSHTQKRATREQFMARDQQLTESYHQMADGKWDKMMQDKHIGYTHWYMPKKHVNPLHLATPDNREGFKEKAAIDPHRGSLDFNNGYALQKQPATKEYTIAAHKYTRKTDGKNASWMFLPDLGRGEGCMGSSNVQSQNSGATLEYEINLTDEGKVAIGILPTQDICPPVDFASASKSMTGPCRPSMPDAVSLTLLPNITPRISHARRYCSHCLPIAALR